MHYDVIIRGGTCVLAWGTYQVDLGILGGRVAAFAPTKADTATREIDARHLHVLPGLIDAHVHLRDPGDGAIESIATGTRAAALGGITTVFDMPNTSPSATSANALEKKRRKIEELSVINVGLYVGATRDNVHLLAELEREEAVCAVKVFAGSSTGDLLIDDDAGIEAVLRHGHRRVAFHAEDDARLRERRKLFSVGEPYARHAEWRDAETALRASQRIVSLAEKTNRPVHILHTSTREELAFFAQHRRSVSVEVLAAHLTEYAPDCYERLGGCAVMNPPLRSKEHHEACWHALRDGRVDVVGSDHAPHALEAKQKPWLQCPSGLPGVQTLVPIMLDHVNAGRLSLERMVDLMAAGPARIYGLRAKGRIAVGFDADLTLVDLASEREIRNEWIASPIGWTPYHGKKVKGWPTMTLVRGHVVMQDDAITSSQAGGLAAFLP